MNTDNSRSLGLDTIRATREFSVTHQLLIEASDPQLLGEFADSLTPWLEAALQTCDLSSSEASLACGWLQDNDYHVRRAIRLTKHDIPRGYHRRLPVAERIDGKLLPRVLSVAQFLVEELSLQITLPRLVDHVKTYQLNRELLEGELWAFPVMARVACLDILRVEFDRIFTPENQSSMITLIDSVSGNDVRESNNEEPVDLAHSASRVAGAISAIIALNEIDWPEFVDATSHIEFILTCDCSGHYSSMNRQSRNRYRTAVEELAYRSRFSEVQVAAKAIEQAELKTDDQRQMHVGYWLVGDGYDALEKSLDCYISPLRQLGKVLRGNTKSVYGLSILMLMGLILWFPVAYAYYEGASNTVALWTFLLSLIPASVLAIALVDYLSVRLVKPFFLPAMDVRNGVPEGANTVVVVPVIVGSPQEARVCIEKLELRYLANPETGLFYSLLSDPVDAISQYLPTDLEIEAELVAGIHRLNARYSETAGDRFTLFHRHREFNESQNCWMAYERKRGKLEQFSMMLTQGSMDPFAVAEGNIEQLRDIRYMITLDADTLLPPGTALGMVCALAHPLNRAVLDERTGRVTAGYTIIQPRIEVLTTGDAISLFAKVFAGDCAIDIYSNAVSNVYQDLFGIGNYVGKGIHDVNAFQISLAQRVPENAILSHDLFEGIHGRVALASDIILYEDFPSNWPEYAARQHRWIRGDWQLLPWIRHKVPVNPGVFDRSVFCVFDRWKLLDNLRRSLIPLALCVYFMAGWFGLPGSPWVWTFFAIGSFIPYLLDEAFSGLATLSKWRRSQGLGHRFQLQAVRVLIAIAFLVVDAINAMDAVFRTLWRVYFSKKELLQWTSSAHASLKRDSSLVSIWRRMWPSPLFAIALAFLLYQWDSIAVLPAAPVLLSWCLAPWLAIYLGKIRQYRHVPLDSGDKLFLRQIARRTWHYFDDFCQPADHWLPPDNYQLSPGPQLAHRTSPTNIGLCLSSTLAARDLGYIGMREYTVRVRNLFDTMERLQRHRGHWLNWYATDSLQPLEPRYISTVDSGNLAVCLIAVKQGCLEYGKLPLLGDDSIAGLMDSWLLVTDSFNALKIKSSQEIEHALLRLHDDLLQLQHNGGYAKLQTFVTVEWPPVEQMLMNAMLADSVHDRVVVHDIHVWLDRFNHHLRSMLRDLDDLAPWQRLFQEMPPGAEPWVQEMRMSLALDLPLGEQLLAAEKLRMQVRSAIPEYDEKPVVRQWLIGLEAALDKGYMAQYSLLSESDVLSNRASRFAYEMDFSWLFNTKNRLFHIGFNLSNSQLDANYYDLLASEARMASFFAIAKHDVPLQHWFHLGRPVIRHGGQPVAQSWNGSMFEYLMPTLFLPGKHDTFLGQSELSAVSSQQSYARKLGVPWGVSESAFAETDAQGNYQYRAFGTPELGIRRGLADDCVVTPYASALALSVKPDDAVANLRQLSSLGVLGIYGFMEALDYTPSRSNSLNTFNLVQSWMAHHQGMSLTAIANVLSSGGMPHRVLQEKSMQAIQLLLQERVPWSAIAEKPRAEGALEKPTSSNNVPLSAEWLPQGSHQNPQIQLLGCGRMSARITQTGGGALFFNDTALTRWNSDASCSTGGYRIHVRDHTSGEQFWLGDSAGTGQAGIVKTSYSNDHVEIIHRLTDYSIRLEITLSARENLDIRRITINNERGVPATVTLTSYAEVALAKVDEYVRHPAFSKLFVHSQRESQVDGISFSRRLRNPEDKAIALLHSIVHEASGQDAFVIETDRAKWLGRLGNEEYPQALTQGLTGTTGWTLDPVMAIQLELSVPPSDSRQCAFLTCTADSTGQAIQSCARFSLSGLNTIFLDSAQVAARELQRLGLHDAQLPVLQRLVSLLIYPHQAMRRINTQTAPVQQRGQAELWSFGISGDLPILLLRMTDDSPPEQLDTLLRAQSLWRLRGLAVDLLIVRVGPESYEEPLRQRLQNSLRETGSFGWLGRRGGVHLVSESGIGEERLFLLEASALVLLNSETSLEQQLDVVLQANVDTLSFQPIGAKARQEIAALEKPAGLLFENTFGGFCGETGDYFIHLEPGKTTPAPWCNVLANNQLGTIVSESGLGFTWSVNSGEHRLTRWSNDPIKDTPGEIVLLRDETTAEYWTVTAAKPYHDTVVQVRHSPGKTSWRRNSHGLEQEMRVFVDVDDPVKCIRLRLKNHSGQARRLTITYFADWLLGATAPQSCTHVRSWYESETQAIVACNYWNPEFAQRLSLLWANKAPHSVSGDRRIFIGERGDIVQPAAMQQSDLGGHFPSGGDACGAYQVHLDLAVGSEEEVVFFVADVDNREELHQLLSRWRNPSLPESAEKKVSEFWRKITSAVTVATPDPAFDLMVNHWLLYQTMSSRLMARAGFYQAGGAFGFRDQLQDVIALLPVAPQRVRQQIVRAARHQFEEGDVLHWWHPPGNRGVRTRITDDRLWLTWATARYVEATGDLSVLDVDVPFLSAEVLQENEAERYTAFAAGDSASVYEHCWRAMEISMDLGSHGLPLIGTGDWNDGMDRIGRKGEGESVWLAWFQINVIFLFLPIVEQRGDRQRAARLRHYAAELKQSIETHAWDGEWYIRAFDDEGNSWGSHTNEECQIDLIAQAWGVLAGFGNEERVLQALQSARKRLIDERHDIVRLLTPPFDQTSRNPGYIKAYPPGIRENGGQYSHAAAWLALAFATVDEADTAYEIFNMINPIARTCNRESALLYSREPYVLAGDIGGVMPQAGRAGWSWYTGSAGWTYQLAVHGLLGIHYVPSGVRISPHLPSSWGSVDVQLRSDRGGIHLVVKKPEKAENSIVSILVDGQSVNSNCFEFPASGRVLEVQITLV